MRSLVCMINIPFMHSILSVYSTKQFLFNNFCCLSLSAFWIAALNPGLFFFLSAHSIPKINIWKLSLIKCTVYADPFRRFCYKLLVSFLLKLRSIAMPTNSNIYIMWKMVETRRCQKRQYLMLSSCSSWLIPFSARRTNPNARQAILCSVYLFNGKAFILGCNSCAYVSVCGRNRAPNRNKIYAHQNK